MIKKLINDLCKITNLEMKDLETAINNWVESSDDYAYANDLQNINYIIIQNKDKNLLKEIKETCPVKDLDGELYVSKIGQYEDIETKFDEQRQLKEDEEYYIEICPINYSCYEFLTKTLSNFCKEKRICLQAICENDDANMGFRFVFIQNGAYFVESYIEEIESNDKNYAYYVGSMILDIFGSFDNCFNTNIFDGK